MTIDHIGIVVPSLEEAIADWQRLFGYVKNSSIVTNTRQAVRVVFLRKENSLTVKLVEPFGNASPVAQFARRGGGLHHICFRCDDLETGIRALADRGARVIVPPQPGEAFEDRNIAFLWIQPGIHIELIDTTKKKGWLD